jgi:hypothetical protein
MQEIRKDSRLVTGSYDYRTNPREEVRVEVQNLL